MKPIVILPEGLMSREDIAKLEGNFLCAVECKDPSKVKFLDPIPSAGDRGKIARAAIELSRIVLTGAWGQYFTGEALGRQQMSRIFCDLLMKGTELDPNGTTDKPFDPDPTGLIDGVTVVAGDSSGVLLAGKYNPADRTFDTSDPTKATAFVRADGSPGAKEIDFGLDPHPGPGSGAGFLVVKVTYTVQGTPPPEDATNVTAEVGSPEDIHFWG
jgi:hypothetical protein